VLEITDLSHSYGRGGGTHLAVDGISLKAEKGEIVSIVGASGCGKSTVLRCIAGLQRPTRGTIRVNGAMVDAAVPEGLAVVFQDYSRSLYPWLSVRDNVALPLVRTQASRAQRGRTAEDALQTVGLGDTGCVAEGDTDGAGAATTDTPSAAAPGQSVGTVGSGDADGLGFLLALAAAAAAACCVTQSLRLP